jgi:hypothetical protein
LFSRETATRTCQQRYREAWRADALSRGLAAARASRLRIVLR